MTTHRGVWRYRSQPPSDFGPSSQVRVKFQNPTSIPWDTWYCRLDICSALSNHSVNDLNIAERCWKTWELTDEEPSPDLSTYPSVSEKTLMNRQTGSWYNKSTKANGQLGIEIGRVIATRSAVRSISTTHSSPRSWFPLFFYSLRPVFSYMKASCYW
jgi:hypothetical protein